MLQRNGATKRKKRVAGDMGDGPIVSEHAAVKKRRISSKIPPKPYVAAMDLTLLLELPGEIFVKIVSYLMQSDLQAFGQTNKAMQAMITDLRSDISFQLRNIHELKCEAINVLFERQLFNYLNEIHHSSKLANHLEEKAILAKLYQDVFGDDRKINGQLNAYTTKAQLKAKVPVDLINNIAKILQSIASQLTGDTAKGLNRLALYGEYMLLARYFYKELLALKIHIVYERKQLNTLAQFSINEILSNNEFNELYKDALKLQIAKLGYEFKKVILNINQRLSISNKPMIQLDDAVKTYLKNIAYQHVVYEERANILLGEFYKFIIFLLTGNKTDLNSMFQSLITAMHDCLPELNARLISMLRTDKFLLLATYLYGEGYLKAISPASTHRFYKSYYIQSPYQPQHDPKLDDFLVAKYKAQYQHLSQDELIREMTKLADADVGMVTNYSIQFKVIADSLNIIANYVDIYAQYSNRQLVVGYQALSFGSRDTSADQPLMLSAIKKVASDRGLSMEQLAKMKDEMIEDFQNYAAANMDDEEIFSMLAKFLGGTDDMDSERSIKIQALDLIIARRSKRLRDGYSELSQMQLLANLQSISPRINLQAPPGEVKANIINHTAMTGIQKLCTLAMYDILLMDAPFFDMKAYRVHLAKKEAQSQVIAPATTFKR
jgi:hypothetical protein